MTRHSTPGRRSFYPIKITAAIQGFVSHTAKTWALFRPVRWWSWCWCGHLAAF